MAEECSDIALHSNISRSYGRFSLNPGSGMLGFLQTQHKLAAICVDSTVAVNDTYITNVLSCITAEYSETLLPMVSQKM